MNKKITQLNPYTTPQPTDLLPIVDLSGTETKKVEVQDLVTDETISTSDVTTNNATTGKHGFLKKLSGNPNEVLNGLGNFVVPSGIGTSFIITQAAHGFVKGDVIRPDAAQFVKSIATQSSPADLSSEAWAIVTDFTTNTFTAQPLDGSRITDATIVALISAYTGGIALYLSEATAGTFSNLEPSGLGNVSKPIGYVEADSGGVPIALITTNYRGVYSFYPVTGKFTTVGGSATENFTITGIDVPDLGYVQLVNQGTNTVTVLTAEVTAPDTLTVVFSGDPSSDAVFNYVIHQ